MEEIDSVLERWKRPFIEFVDDNALVDRRYWKTMLRELALRKIRWFAECDVSIGDDDELMALMYQSGCREVLIGLESPVSAELNGLELNSNWKFGAHKGYRRSIKRIQEHGIRVIGCFMVGLDHQTADSAKEIYQFIKDTELFDAQITLQTAFPGTPLYSRLRGAGRLKLSDNHGLCTLFDLNIIPLGMSEEDLLSAFRGLLKLVHSNTEVAWRIKKFKERLRSRSRSWGKLA